MDRAGSFLGQVARRFHRPQAALAWLAATWPATVGPALADRTRPVRCLDGILEIAVDGPSWQRQLQSMSAEFSARINQSWGSALVREIKFLAAPRPGLARIPLESDNAHTPFIRRRKR
jgi:predicted nucleic acid-binding Zn ribbon protein